MKMVPKLIKMSPRLCADVTAAARRRAKRDQEPVNFSATVRELLRVALLITMERSAADNEA